MANVYLFSQSQCVLLVYPFENIEIYSSVKREVGIFQNCLAGEGAGGFSNK